MRFTQTPTADLVPGDVVWRDGEKITVETTELVPATEHCSAFWVINGRVVASASHKWTREERP
jgi:hypothetical protein